MKGLNKLTDGQLIVNEFNFYFSNIATKLKSDNIVQSRKNFDSYLTSKCDVPMFFNPTDEVEVIQIVKNLKSSKSTGFDGISQYIIKQVIHCIVNPLFIYVIFHSYMV